MANANLKGELEKVLGEYKARDLDIDGRVYGGVYTGKGDPVYTTHAGEKLCESSPGMLTSVLLGKSYTGGTQLYDGMHSRVYRINLGVAVKEFVQPVENYFETNVAKAASLKGLKNARMPQPYFARGGVFAMEFVGGIPLPSLRERSEVCYEKVLEKFKKSAAFERMLKNDFNLAGEKSGFENLLVVMKNGKPFFYPIDQ